MCSRMHFYDITASLHTPSDDHHSLLTCCTRSLTLLHRFTLSSPGEISLHFSWIPPTSPSHSRSPRSVHSGLHVPSHCPPRGQPMAALRTVRTRRIIISLSWREHCWEPRTRSPLRPIARAAAPWQAASRQHSCSGQHISTRYRESPPPNAAQLQASDWPSRRRPIGPAAATLPASTLLQKLLP